MNIMDFAYNEYITFLITYRFLMKPNYNVKALQIIGHVSYLRHDDKIQSGNIQKSYSVSVFLCVMYA